MNTPIPIIAANNMEMHTVAEPLITYFCGRPISVVNPDCDRRRWRSYFSKSYQEGKEIPVVYVVLFTELFNMINRIII